MSATLQADLAAFQTAVTNAGTLQDAPYATIAPILAAAMKLSTDLASAISTLDGMIASGMAPATDPTVATAYLLAQLSTMQNEYSLIMAKSFIDRIDVNLQNSAG